MKDWNSVEEKWREQLQNKSDDIPEGLWSRIEERLEEKPLRRFPFYWAAAAMLLIAVGLSWNWQTESTTTSAVATTVLKAEKPANLVTSESNETTEEQQISAISVSSKPAEIPETSTDVAEPILVQDVINKEEVIIAAPNMENKLEPEEEILTLRLDIDPITEEVRPVANSTKRKRTLFGKILGEIRQALDGEPVNWQKIKEGNPALENNIHTVANTYIKTEENLKRTLQLQ